MTPNGGSTIATMAAVASARLIAIIRANDASRARADAEVLISAGVRVIEISLVTPGALDVIAELAGDPALTVGVGTVRSPDHVVSAHDVGARFVVSPDFAPEVVRATVGHGMASFPGAGTVTEMIAARDAGANAVKVFPATVFGSAGIRQVLAALPDLPLVPTGGVAVADMAEYLDAGAMAVGMGAGLVSAARNDLTGLRSAIEALRK